MEATTENVHDSLPAPRAKHRWLRGILLGSVILLCGMLIGAGLTVHTIARGLARGIQNPERVTEHITEHMRSRLDLSDPQADSIHAILTKHQVQLRDILVEIHPHLKDELMAIRAEIKAVLTPEQSEAWGKRMDRLRNRLFGDAAEAPTSNTATSGRDRIP